MASVELIVAGDAANTSEVAASARFAADNVLETPLVVKVKGSRPHRQIAGIATAVFAAILETAPSNGAGHCTGSHIEIKES